MLQQQKSPNGSSSFQKKALYSNIKSNTFYEDSECNIDINDDNDIPNTQHICTYEFAMQNIKSLTKA